MKTEEFEKRQAEMSDKELIERAEKEVSELARTYGKSHRMCIPPMITDTDIILSEVIRRYKKVNKLSKEDVSILQKVNIRNERGYTNAVYGFTEDTHNQMREDIESLLGILNKIITQTN